MSSLYAIYSAKSDYNIYILYVDETLIRLIHDVHNSNPRTNRPVF